MKTKTYRISESDNELNNELCSLFDLSEIELYRWNMFYPSPIETAACFEIAQSCIRVEKKQDDFIRFFSESITKYGRPSDRENIQKQLDDIQNFYKAQVSETEEIKNSLCNLLRELKIRNLSVKQNNSAEGKEIPLSDDEDKEPSVTETFDNASLAKEYAKYADVF